MAKRQIFFLSIIVFCFLGSGRGVGGKRVLMPFLIQFIVIFSQNSTGWGSVPPNHLTISWICLFWLVWIQVNHYNYYKLYKLFSYYLRICLNITWSFVCMKAFSTTYNRHWESWRIVHARPVHKLSWACHEARSWTLQIRHGWSYNPQRNPFSSW